MDDRNFRNVNSNTFTMDLLTGGGVVSEPGPRNVAQAGIVQSGSSSFAMLVLLNSPSAEDSGGTRVQNAQHVVSRTCLLTRVRFFQGP